MRKNSELIESLKIAGAGANLIGQVFRWIEIKKQWKNKSNAERAGEILDSGSTTLAEGGMIADNIHKLVKKGSASDTSGIFWNSSRRNKRTCRSR